MSLDFDPDWIHQVHAAYCRYDLTKAAERIINAGVAGDFSDEDYDLVQDFVFQQGWVITPGYDAARFVLEQING